jgi:tetratricopeptide (TPR) repeat protein
MANDTSSGTPTRTQTDDKRTDTSTKTLSLEEYRDWVHERVARGVMLKLGTILGVIGVGGLLTIVAALAGLGQRELQNQVQTRVEKDVEKNLKPVETNLAQTTNALKTTVDDFKHDVRTFMDDTRERFRDGILNVRQGIPGEVARTLLEQAQLTKELKALAEKEIKQKVPEIGGIAETAVRSAVAKEMTPEKIKSEAKRAVDSAFEASGGPAALFEAKLRPIVFDSYAPLTHREQSLRLLTIFATNAKQLRGELLRVIKETAPHERELRRIALQQYRACDAKSEDCTQAREDAEAVVAIVERLRGRSTQLEILTHRDIDRDTSEDYISFLARFGPEPAAPLLKLAREERLTETSAKIVAHALGRMGREEAVGALIDMVGRLDGEAGRAAWQSLSRLNPRDVWANQAARREAVRAVSELVPRHLSRVRAARKEALEAHVDRLIRAIQGNDRGSLLRLQAEAQSFGSSRLDFLYRRLLDNPDDALTVAIRRDAARMVRGFIDSESLDDDDQDVMVTALAALFRLEDWSLIVQRRILTGAGRGQEARAGLDVLISGWIRRLEYEHPRLEGATKYVSELATATLELQDCLYYSGSSRAVGLAIQHDARRATPLVLRRLGSLFTAERAGTVLRGRPVVLAALDAYVPEPGAPDLMREAIASLAKDQERAPVLADIIGALAQQKSRAGDWAQAARWYSEAIALNPGTPDYYVGRSQSYFRLDRKREAGEDLDAALTRNARIDTDIALEFVAHGDEASARRAVLRSVELSEGPREKAEALENLGLYYIRKKDFPKAFAHTTEVLKLNDGTSWNWMVRAIAARRLAFKDEEERARKAWDATKQRRDVESLSKYIKEEIEAFLAGR